MALREEFEQVGQWLFRWRSYLPLLMFGLVLLALRHFSYPHDSHALDQLWEFACFALSLAGLGLRAATVGCAPKGTSGRNVAGQVADSLTTSGLYSVVRHPLYLGNFLMGLGVALFPRLWWVTLLYILSFWLYYERIMFAEEEFLRRKFGDRYVAWASRTPAFVPRVTRWRPPALPFSWRWALRREYASFFALVVAFTVLEVIGDAVATGRLTLDPIWGVLLALSAILYAVLRVLSKRTSLLAVPGR